MELLREELGVEARMEMGHSGIFTVAVGGTIVARKTLDGFPSEEEILDGVRAALARAPG